MTIRSRTWEILEAAKDDDSASRTFDILILTLIFLNVVAVVLGSERSIQQKWGDELYAFELVSVIIFTFEYLARLWSCMTDPRYARGITGRIRHAFHPMSLIDLLAILPFYLPFVGVDLRSLRALRLLRILRVAKAGRYYSSLNLIKHVLRNKKEELVLSSALMAFLLIVSSSVLYYCENPIQPETFSSIPATMWWAVATLTTVGYGDMCPITLSGKVCASVISVLGIGMFALPTGILGAGFVEAIERHKKPASVCPHCGEQLD